jgi:PAS domain S-box-containing protein
MTKQDGSHLKGDSPVAAVVTALEDRQALAATAFERTRMPMVVTDARHPNYPIVLANQAFLNLTGYSAAEVLGRNCRFLQGEATSRAAVAEIRSGIRADRDVTVELLNYRKNGSAFWNQLHITPVHDDTGQLLYHFGSQIDQTKYREVQALEASEHRLLMEVDHRSKNVLALVDSITRLSQADDPHRYAAAVQRRVRSLSVTHQLLAQKNWQDVRLDEVCRAQLDFLHGHAIILEGPEVKVPAEAAQPLGLVIHELAVNAAEHGALSHGGGTLQVRWNKADNDNTFLLEWAEHGGPPVTKPSDLGFGLVMSEGTVRLQLFGDIQWRWEPTGLVTTIKIPDPSLHMADKGPFTR